MNVSNINISNVQIKSNRGAFIAEADGVKLNNVQINVTTEPNLILKNTKNIEIEGLNSNGNNTTQVIVSGKNTKNINIVKNNTNPIDISFDDLTDKGQVKSSN